MRILQIAAIIFAVAISTKVSSDNTHPTQSGAEYMAIRCATGIAAICANL